MSILTLPTLFGSLVAAAVLAPAAPVATLSESVLLEVTPVIEESVITLDVLLRQAEEVYPEPKGDLHLELATDGKDLTLLDVLIAYGDLTDQTFTFTDETANRLRHSDLTLSRSQAVPKESVQYWVEHLLNENGFLFQPLLNSNPRLITLFDGRTSNNPSSISVPVEDIEKWSSNAATVVSTTLTLPNLDVRQLSNSMRTMIPDQNTQTLLPAGNSHSMYIAGRAPFVAETVAMLQRVNDAAKQDHFSKPTQDMQIMRFPLEHAHAGSAAELVEELILSTVARPNPSNMSVVQPRAVRVLADPRTNALIATVQPDLVERLKQAVALIDVEVTD